MDLRDRLERQGFDADAAWALVDADRGETAAFRRELAAEFGVADLHGGDREAVSEALERLAGGDTDGAVAHLRERFGSVCERENPELPDRDAGAACHLYDRE